ncbi:MAG: nucleotidyl transferase AbiEii/AbiGii toxin family protein [Rhodospirillales bacterium]
MIPSQHINAWSSAAPWANVRQIEQDLVISRAVVDIFSDAMLHEELRFRGGTALHKLHLPTPQRYSEDIDLTRTSAGPIRPIIYQLRHVLEPWLGSANFKQSPLAPKLIFRASAEGGGEIKLKVEINTREREAFDPPQLLPFRIDNPWFSGETTVATFSNEEILATKLRALLQRNQGRDLYDIAHALDVFEGLNDSRIAEMFTLYLQLRDRNISRARAEERMFEKLGKPEFLKDVQPLLPAEQAAQWTEAAMAEAFQNVFTRLIVRLPGEPWAKTPEMKEKFSLPW